MCKKIKLLIVEDDESIRETTLKGLKKNHKLEIAEAGSAEELFRLLKNERYHIILLDTTLPGMSGTDALRKLVDEYPKIRVVMLSSRTDDSLALRCLEIGAFEFLRKNKDFDAINSVVNHVIAGSEELAGLNDNGQEENCKYLDKLIGISDEVQLIRKQIRRIVSSQISTVLIQGESGTGKEVVSQVIHDGSGKVGNYISINCAALPENLLESELFGHEKGAFTGATDKKRGLFELVGDGTILLDEIGELAYPLQSKLLRVIEARKFRPVGGASDIPFRARLIAATNRDLEHEAEKGRFRADLYYRLNIIPLHLSPLRVIPGDIRVLALHFIEKLNNELNTTVRTISAGTMSLLCRYAWPGNARELRNVLERIMVMNDNTTIMADHLPEHIRHYNGKAVTADIRGADADGWKIKLPKEGLELEEVEKELIRQALERSSNNITHAGTLLGLHRDTLRYRAKKFELIKSD